MSHNMLIEGYREYRLALADNPHPSDPWWRKLARRAARFARRYVW